MSIYDAAVRLFQNFHCARLGAFNFFFPARGLLLMAPSSIVVGVALVQIRYIEKLDLFSNFTSFHQESCLSSISIALALLSRSGPL